MTSLARGLIVIQAFTQQNPQMTISQLSVKTGLSRAAVRRCLYTLSKLGFAGAEDGQRYALRPRMLSLSHTYTTSSTLSTAAQPILERMSLAFRESFSVATLDGNEIVYIARTQVPSRVMAVDLHIGSRLPAYCTSMGRVLLACPPAGLRAGRPGARGGAAVARRPGLRAVRSRGRHRQSLRQRSAHAGLRHADTLSYALAECSRRAQHLSAVGLAVVICHKAGVVAAIQTHDPIGGAIFVFRSF
jgi:DNA-binding IclR family transcriptional regulator